VSSLALKLVSHLGCMAKEHKSHKHKYELDLNPHPGGLQCAALTSAPSEHAKLYSLNKSTINIRINFV